MSLYHNVTYFVADAGGMPAGGEVLVDRSGWLRGEAARRRRQREMGKGEGEDEAETARKNEGDRLRSIREGGICMDNLQVRADTVGGGIASGFLLEGSIVAPVPVLPLPRDGIRYLRSEERKRAERH